MKLVTRDAGAKPDAPETAAGPGADEGEWSIAIATPTLEMTTAATTTLAAVDLMVDAIASEGNREFERVRRWKLKKE
ncbi:hypothetical protein R1flu_024952 [Riccia fluitans]|uniref:Cyclic pyranopterin monophosphate synthase n=1 Tax=Riccia fluitans TaxID=41844 RepID=A0ABD1XWD0_9MARC